MLKTQIRGLPRDSVRSIFFFSFPLIVAQGCNGLMMITDRYLLSCFDPIGAPIAMTGAMGVFTLWIFFSGVLAMISPIVARLRGEGGDNRADQVLLQGVLISLLAAGLLAVFGITLSKTYLLFLHVPDSIVNSALDYISVLVFGSVFVFLKDSLSAFFSGLGKTKWILWTSLVGVSLNLPLSYLLVRGDIIEIPFQYSPIEGAAIGTLISEVVMLFIYGYFYKVYKRKKTLFEGWTWNTKVLVQLLQQGTGTGFEFLVLTLAFNTFLNAFQSLGEKAAYSISVVTSWSWLISLPFLGLNAGIMSLIGYVLGQKDYRLAKNTVKSGLMMTLGLSLVVSFGFWFAPEWFVGLFSGQRSAVDQLTLQMMMLLPILICCDAISFVLTAALRAGGEAHYCFRLSLFVQWGALAVIGFGIYQFGWGPMKAWGVFLFALLVQSVFHCLRYKKGFWLTRLQGM